MRITNNNRSINLNNLFKKLFSTKRNTLLTVFSLQIFFILVAGLNASRIYRAAKYFSSLEYLDISNYLKELITSYDLDNKIERMDLIIDLKNISKLDCLRQSKKTDKFSQNCKGNTWAKGSLEVNDQIYKVKLRAKGDRSLHRLNFKKMSFKVDIKGEKRLKGIEEFSLQNPIIRGYTNELIAADLVRENNIVSPRNYYFKLYINGEYVGLRHLEESYSRELIEANGRRYGPVFSLDEEVSMGNIFGETRFDLADFKNWKNVDIARNSLTTLEMIQINPKLIKIFFDMKLWAKYFALMDILETYHGTIPKSVKIFLNPTTGLFEPAFFDGHQGTGPRNNFLLINFSKKNKSEINCAWICKHSNWYKSFFMNNGQLDKDFYVEYFNALKRFSSPYYKLNKIDPKIKELSPIRGVLYRNFSKYDDIFYEGLVPHIAKHSLLINRINNINLLINRAESLRPFIAVSKENNLISFTNQSSELPQVVNVLCKGKISEPFILNKNQVVTFNLKDFHIGCNYENTEYTLNQSKSKYAIASEPLGNIEIQKDFIDEKQVLFHKKNDNEFKFDKKNLVIENDLNIFNKKIVFENDINLCIKNNSVLQIKNSQIIDKNNRSKLIFKGCDNGSGSVVIQNSDLNMNSLMVDGLSKPQMPLRSLYSGLNIIKSKVKIGELFIRNSLSEDGVNFIDSKVNIDLISAEAIKSDAIDSDSSELKVNEVFCSNVKNDCLDLSYSYGTIEKLKANNIKDKAVSAGERSNLKINFLEVENSEMGLVAKDSSFVDINSFENSSVNLPIVAFIKKRELGSPTIQVKKINKESIKKSLISNDSKVSISGKLLEGYLDSNKISEMLYGNQYGVKTER